MSAADYSVARLTARSDDGIVVVREVGRRSEQEETSMPRPTVGLRLRETLGQEASEDLLKALDEVQADMLAITGERFEARLTATASELRGEMTDGFSKLRVEMVESAAKLRVEMAEGFANLRKGMSEMRVDILRWSFLFWIGQIAMLISVLSYMLRPFAR
jgi:hypothetical protein